MLSKLLLTIFLSASFRSPNAPPGTPYDYEYAGGIKTPTFKCEILKERELGLIHKGNEVFKKFVRKSYIVELEHFKRTARDIDSQKVTLRFPVDTAFSIGTVGNTRFWNDYEQRLGAFLDWKGLTARMETHFQGVDAYSVQYSHIFELRDDKGKPISDKYLFGLEPLLVYRAERDNKFWQAKLSLLFGVKKE